MKCKNCNAELEDGVTVCPDCGMDNAPEEEIAQQEQPEIAVPAEEPEKYPETAAPAAAEEPEEEAQAPEKKKKTGKIVLAVVGCVLLVGVLVCALLYGMGFDFKPKANDVFYKESYTVTDEKAEKHADKVVAKLGDYELTNGELQIYYQMNLANFMQYYGYMAGIDPMKPLDQQVQDPQTGHTWQQFFLDNSIKSWQRYTTLQMLAKEANFEVDSTTKEFLTGLQTRLEETAKQAGFQSVEELVKEEMGASATAEGYCNYMNTYYESLAYYDSIYDQMVPTDEEVEAYYDENAADYESKHILKSGDDVVNVRHILITPEGGTPNEDGRTFTYSEEAWNACLEKAQGLLDQWKAGEATEESFAKLATEHTTDGGSKENGGLYTDVAKGQMVSEFDAWIFDDARQAGDTDLVKSVFGYHIMYYVNSHPMWQKVAREDLVTERTNQMIEDGIAKWPMTVSYKKIALSDPMAKKQEAQPSIPEVTAPATDAPETSIPETTVPETTVPETAAPSESVG